MGKKYHWWASVKKVLILVEGATEEKFVKDILCPYFISKSIYLIPRNLNGVSRYKEIKHELNSLLKDTSATIVTTMIDLYRIPSDFPMKASIPTTHNYRQKVQFLEEHFLNNISKDHFIPYLQLHEFEALLFSDVSHFGKIPGVGNKVNQLHEVLKHLEPEEINELPNTAPSRRIISIIGRHYMKPVHGIIVAKAIGLEKIREQCPHFNQWVEAVESRCLG